MAIMLKKVVCVLEIVLLALSGKCLAAPQFLQSIVDNKQVIYTHSAVGSKALLEAWEKREGKWVQKFEASPVIIGVNGITSPEDKCEGDGKTPTGLYALGLAFGYESLPGVKVPYRVMDANDFWVDDPGSMMYNRLVRGKPDATSYEVMRRQDIQYKLGMVVEYNTNPVVAYKGSAIFLHIWRNKDAVTAGCIAVPENRLHQLLLWLDAGKNPVIMIE